MESIAQVMSMEGEMVTSVLLRADGTSSEVQLDSTPRANAAGHLLGGVPTFIGQWPQLNVVLMCARLPATDAPFNAHVLKKPFGKLTGKVQGDILLMRMDNDAVPASFTLKEYQEFLEAPDTDERDEVEEDDEDMFPLQGETNDNEDWAEGSGSEADEDFMDPGSLGEDDDMESGDEEDEEEEEEEEPET